MTVRAGLTADLAERAILQASVQAITLEIQEARAGRPILAAGPPAFDGAVIVLIADEGTVDYADGDSAPQHCTIAYLGNQADLTDDDRRHVHAAAQRLAANLGSFTPNVLSPARFGDDDVLLVEHPDIQRARDIAMTDRNVARLVLGSDAHPHYIPHVTGATHAPTFGHVGAWMGDDRTEYPLGSAVTAAAAFEILHPRGRKGWFIKKFGLVDVFGLHGFQHGQRGDRSVQGEVDDIIDNPDDPDEPIIRIKLTDPRWDTAKFGETIDVRRDQVGKRADVKAKIPGEPKDPTAGLDKLPVQYTSKTDTGIIPKRTPLSGYTEAPNSPHLKPLQQPPDWVAMGSENRKAWLKQQMEADYTALRGKQTTFDFTQFESGIAFNLANAYRELTNWDPDTAMRIDRGIVAPSLDPDAVADVNKPGIGSSTLGLSAIAVARPGTAHPGGIGPKVKDSAIVLAPSYFRNMAEYDHEKSTSDYLEDHGDLPWSVSSKYADPTLTLAHEFAHQRQFRLLHVAMSQVGQAWSPIVRDDGFGTIPDSSNWKETQDARYSIQAIAPTKYGRTKSSEAYAEAWAARGVGLASGELTTITDQWDEYMNLPEQLPADRFAETSTFSTLTPDQQDTYWQAAGPILNLPGMREHYPETAADYDTWAKAHPGSALDSSPDAATISPTEIAKVTEQPGPAEMQAPHELKVGSPVTLTGKVRGSTLDGMDLEGRIGEVEAIEPDPDTGETVYQVGIVPGITAPLHRDNIAAVTGEPNARVGDRVTFNGKPAKITSIISGKAIVVADDGEIGQISVAVRPYGEPGLPTERELEAARPAEAGLREIQSEERTMRAEGRVIPGVGDVDAFIAANPRKPGEEYFIWQARICDKLPPDAKHALLFESRERYPPVDYIAAGAARWRAEHGLPEPAVDISEVPAPRLKAEVVAKFFEQTPDQSDDPQVQAAFYEFKRQNEEMWNFMTRPESEGGLGIKITFTPYDAGDPYPSATAQAEDLRVNHHMTTQSGLGGPHQATMTIDEYNRFRAVHDVFGHAAIGGGFDRHGEYQAYLSHSSMYTGDGRRAMASEYHGVNTALWAGAPGSAAEWGKSILLPEPLIPNPWGPTGEMIAASGALVAAMLNVIQRQALGVTPQTMEAIDYLIKRIGIMPTFGEHYDPSPFHHLPAGV